VLPDSPAELCQLVLAAGAPMIAMVAAWLVLTPVMFRGPVLAAG